MTKWKPDTCACHMEWDEPLDKTKVRMLARCPKHETYVEAKALNDNKNKAVDAYAKAENIKRDDVKWSYDKDAKLVLERV